jgi:hypothetical protein
LDPARGEGEGELLHEVPGVRLGFLAQEKELEPGEGIGHGCRHFTLSQLADQAQVRDGGLGVSSHFPDQRDQKQVVPTEVSAPGRISRWLDDSDPLPISRHPGAEPDLAAGFGHPPIGRVT